MLAYDARIAGTQDAATTPMPIATAHRHLRVLITAALAVAC